jgi:hypothetical protein
MEALANISENKSSVPKSQIFQPLYSCFESFLQENVKKQFFFSFQALLTRSISTESLNTIWPIKSNPFVSGEI